MHRKSWCTLLEDVNNPTMCNAMYNPHDQFYDTDLCAYLRRQQETCCCLAQKVLNSQETFQNLTRSRSITKAMVSHNSIVDSLGGPLAGPSRCIWHSFRQLHKTKPSFLKLQAKWHLAFPHVSLMILNKNKFSLHRDMGTTSLKTKSNWVCISKSAVSWKKG